MNNDVIFRLSGVAFMPENNLAVEVFATEVYASSYSEAYTKLQDLTRPLGFHTENVKFVVEPIF